MKKPAATAGFFLQAGGRPQIGRLPYLLSGFFGGSATTLASTSCTLPPLARNSSIARARASRSLFLASTLGNSSTDTAALALPLALGAASSPTLSSTSSATSSAATSRPSSVSSSSPTSRSSCSRSSSLMFYLMTCEKQISYSPASPSVEVAGKKSTSTQSPLAYAPSPCKVARTLRAPP